MSHVFIYFWVMLSVFYLQVCFKRITSQLPECDELGLFYEMKI